jgi:hypothetical protein
LPELNAEGINLRLILGHAYGKTAPAKVFSDTFYADVTMQPRSLLPLPDDHEDRGLYITESSVSIAGQTFEAGRMMVFRPGDKITVAAGERGARLMILGGATLEGRATSSGTLSLQAKKSSRKPNTNGVANWGNGLFDLPSDDRAEFIPLPGQRAENWTPCPKSRSTARKPAA